MKRAEGYPMPAGSSDERLAILAHELRSPLSALTSAAEALVRCASEPTIIRLSGIVSRQTAAMRALVDELLDRPESRFRKMYDLQSSMPDAPTPPQEPPDELPPELGGGRA